MDTDWSMIQILRTCDLHEPINLLNWYCTKLSHLAKVYLLERCPIFTWRSQEMEKYLCILGVYSSALALSLLIQYGLFLICFFLTLKYIHGFLLWPIFSQTKEPSCSQFFSLGIHLCVLIKPLFRFPFDKRNRPSSLQGFFSVRFIPSNNFWD